MPSIPRSKDAPRVTTHEIQVITPYRLDLTVSALRRMSTNLVDVYTPDGRYLRALGGFAEPGNVLPPDPRLAFDRARALASAAMITARHATLLLTGHGAPVSG